MILLIKEFLEALIGVVICKDRVMSDSFSMKDLLARDCCLTRLLIKGKAVFVGDCHDKIE